MCYLEKEGIYYKDSHGGKKEKIAGSGFTFQNLSPCPSQHLGFPRKFSVSFSLLLNFAYNVLALSSFRLTRGFRLPWANSVCWLPFSFSFVMNWFSLCIFFFYFLTLQYCIGFAIYRHASAAGIHVFPILNPPPSSLPVPSLWVVPVHQPQASSIVH